MIHNSMCYFEINGRQSIQIKSTTKIVILILVINDNFITKGF